jgi:hypothetical protein
VSPLSLVTIARGQALAEMMQEEMELLRVIRSTHQPWPLKWRPGQQLSLFPIAVTLAVRTTLVDIRRAVVASAGVHGGSAVVIVVIAWMVALPVRRAADSDIEPGSSEVDSLRGTGRRGGASHSDETTALVIIRIVRSFRVPLPLSGALYEDKHEGSLTVPVGTQLTAGFETDVDVMTLKRNGTSVWTRPRGGRPAACFQATVAVSKRPSV